MRRNLTSNQNAKDKHTVKKDAAIQAIVNSTPAQIETYIENNVTDLDSAKEVLTKLAKVVAILARREFKEN